MTRRLLLHAQPSVLRNAAIEAWQPGMRVVVPNVQAGIDFKRHLDRDAQTITLTQLARNELRRDGWTQLHPGEAARLLSKILAEIKLEYLGPIRERPSTATSLLSLIGELERAHLLPADLQRVATTARERDVACIYAAYHARCCERRCYDAPGTEHYAALLPQLGAWQILLHGFAYFDAAQHHLITRLLAPGSVLTLPLDPADGPASRTRQSAEWFEPRGFLPVNLEGTPETIGDSAIASYLQPQLVSGLVKAEFPDIDAEVRACLREVRSWLAEGTPPEDIAIVIRQESQYLETLADIAREYNVPLVSGAQRALLQTGLGSFLQAWINAHRSEWRFSDTQALLTHPLLRLPFDASERARQLRTRSPRGLRAWSPDLAWLELPADTTWKEALVGVLQRMITDLGIRDRCRTEPELNVALNLFMDRLRPDARRDTPCSQEDVLSALAFTLRDVRLPALLGKAAVRVLNPLGALGRSFGRVWVLGLSNTIFPAVHIDHPLVDAHTRQRWQQSEVTLPDLTSFTGVESALFLGSVATAGESLILSRPRRGVSGRELAPSPYWDRLTGAATLTERPPASKIEHERLLSLVGQPARRWQRGLHAEQAHGSGALTTHTGQLSTSIDVSGRVWTVSELRTAITCGHRWWVEAVLGAELPLFSARSDLSRSVLQAILTQSQDDPSSLADLVPRVLDDLVRHGPRDRWTTGPLWPARRIELQRQLQQVVAHPDFLPQGWVPGLWRPERPFVLTAHGHRFAIQLPPTRLDQTPTGSVLTVYRDSRADQHSPLSLDMELALCLQASSASSGRYVLTTTGEAFGTLHYVPRPTAESPINGLRALLADLGDTLAAGNVAAQPNRDACTHCPLLHTCRAHAQEAA